MTENEKKPKRWTAKEDWTKGTLDPDQTVVRFSPDMTREFKKLSKALEFATMTPEDREVLERWATGKPTHVSTVICYLPSIAVAARERTLRTGDGGAWEAWTDASLHLMRHTVEMEKIFALVPPRTQSR